MPYIRQELRIDLDPSIDNLVKVLEGRMSMPGEVNYVITRLIDALYGRGGYVDLNEAIGIFECAKLEFYRKRVVPFEEKAKARNGEVYD